jgi:hypothetical protein
MAGKRVIVDGRIVVLPEGASRVSDLRRQRNIPETEEFVQIKGTSSKVLKDSDELEDDARLQSIPAIIKG